MQIAESTTYVCVTQSYIFYCSTYGVMHNELPEEQVADLNMKTRVEDTMAKRRLCLTRRNVWQDWNGCTAHYFQTRRSRQTGSFISHQIIWCWLRVVCLSPDWYLCNRLVAAADDVMSCWLAVWLTETKTAVDVVRRYAKEMLKMKIGNLHNNCCEQHSKALQSWETFFRVVWFEWE